MAWLAVVQAMLDLSQRDTAKAAKALEAARAASSRLPPAVDALRRLNEGRLRIARGDIPGGLTQMEAALKDAEAAPPVETVPPVFFHRMYLALAHAGYAPTRLRGIAEIRELMTNLRTSLFGPVLQLHLARALEAAGQREAAVKEYAGFVILTKRAEGPLAQMHAEAKAALVRLRPKG